MGKQEDFVLRALEERDVRFVRLWFTDVLGFLKSVAVAPAELENAFEEGIGIDGSASGVRMSQNIRAVPCRSPRHGSTWNVDGSGLASMSAS